MLNARNPASRATRILRALADHPEGRLTTELIADLAEPAGKPRQQTLTWYGAILRRHEAQGLAERTGRTAGAWQSGPVGRWRITPAGLACLRAAEEPPRQRVPGWRQPAWYRRLNTEGMMAGLGTVTMTRSRARP
jgi:hypothetical protein